MASGQSLTVKMVIGLVQLLRTLPSAPLRHQVSPIRILRAIFQARNVSVQAEQARMSDALRKLVSTSRTVLEALSSPDFNNSIAQLEAAASLLANEAATPLRHRRSFSQQSVANHLAQKPLASAAGATSAAHGAALTATAAGRLQRAVRETCARFALEHYSISITPGRVRPTHLMSLCQEHKHRKAPFCRSVRLKAMTLS